METFSERCPACGNRTLFSHQHDWPGDIRVHCRRHECGFAADLMIVKGNAPGTLDTEALRESHRSWKRFEQEIDMQKDPGLALRLLPPQRSQGRP